MNEQYDEPGQARFFSVGLSHTAVQPARMVIRRTSDGKVLLERLLSAAAPELQPESAVIDANGDLQVKFNASDADGDAFEVMGQYIDADGRIQVIFPWRTWGAPNFTCSPCTFPAHTLAGGAGKVRLFASDGLRTTMAEIPLRVPNYAPEVAINPVQHGRTVADGYATFLVWPAAWDAEDGPIDARSLKWFVNGQRVNCDCAVLPLSAEMTGMSRAAAAEEVTVTLEVTDSDRQTARATAVVDLTPALATAVYTTRLPVILK